MGLLIRGSVGDAVRSLQENLTTLGYPADVDGIYGPATEEAVRGFQDAYGLAADGKAGPNTLAKIDEMLEQVNERDTTDTPADDSQTDDSQTDDSQTDDSQTDDSQTDDSQTDDSNASS